MNGCVDFIVMSRLQDGTLSAEESSRVQGHLSGCADCRLKVRTKVVFDRALAGAVTPGEARVEDCPDLTALASFAEGRLAAASRQQITLHLADCGACLSSVAALGRELAEVTELSLAAVPESVLEQARSMAPAPVTATAESAQPAREALDGWLGSCWRWLEGLRLAPGLGLATVAAAVLAAVLLLPPVIDNPVPPALERGVSTSPLVELETPGADQSIAISELVLTWRPTSAASSYTVTVVDASGAFFRQYAAAGSSVELPAGDGWIAGARYTWWVTALLEDGTHQASDHRSFRVQGPPAP